MANSRSISPDLWLKVHQRLVFYFSRRHGDCDAEDLAQQTLAVMWARDDYQFEEKDFLRVCLGFARNISREGHRERLRYSGGEVDSDLAAPGGAWGGQQATESGILLDQILQTAESQLPERDFQLILQAAHSEGERIEDLAEANRKRVSRHRAILKLAKALGLHRGEV